MPKALERKLWARVRRKHPGWSGRRKRAYVYGTLRKTGWVPSHQRGFRARVKHSRGYKKCIVNALVRKKFTTPRSAARAFSAAKNKCRKHVRYAKHR